MSEFIKILWSCFYFQNEENPCNDEDLVSKRDEKEDEDGAEKGRNPSGDGIENDDRQKSSRLSPDEELARLEKRAQAIREMLRAVEEEEARLRAEKQQETGTDAKIESDVQDSEPHQEPDKSVDDGDVDESKELETTGEEAPNESESNLAIEVIPDLLISRVVEDDEDSIDRELKGSDWCCNL